jgi:hypothetical protein
MDNDFVGLLEVLNTSSTGQRNYCDHMMELEFLHSVEIEKLITSCGAAMQQSEYY